MSLPSVTVKLGSFASLALGPALTRTIPIASDLRPWAFSFSLIVSVVAFAWLSVRFAEESARKMVKRELFVWLLAAVVFAFGYIALNLLWTVESADWRDVPWKLGLIGTFGLGVGSVTGSLVALEKSLNRAK